MGPERWVGEDSVITCVLGRAARAAEVQSEVPPRCRASCPQTHNLSNAYKFVSPDLGHLTLKIITNMLILVSLAHRRKTGTKSTLWKQGIVQCCQFNWSS